MMEGSMKVNEIKEKCMEKEFMHGQMEGVIRVNIIWIKKKDMAYFVGLIILNIEGFGKMEISMVKKLILALIKLKKKEFGFYNNNL